MFNPKSVGLLVLSVMGQSVVSAKGTEGKAEVRKLAVQGCNEGVDCCLASTSCSEVGKAGGSVLIGQGSCNAFRSCRWLGRAANSTITVGTGSCNFMEACTDSFTNENARGSIGDNSCNKYAACAYLPSFAIIGDGSCNCDYCCACLEEEDEIPDGKCNQIGECCVDTGGGVIEKSDNFDEAIAKEVAGLGDPIILGYQNQVFKFEGRDGAWYSNLASKELQWNMRFQKFDTCPEDENMFVTGIALSMADSRDETGSKSNILIATTTEPTEECKSDPNKVCLGEGTLHMSFDGGNTFVSQPGDYKFSSYGRVVAHNTFAACSRKWHDYDISNNDWRGNSLREGGRRMAVVEKKPLQLLSDQKLKMIDPSECGSWIDDRSAYNDLFDQKGHWSTIYVETPEVSFHIEYRRSDWFDPKCDYQSLDAWMTKVTKKMDKEDWGGVLGETKVKIFDKATGEQIKSDRMKLLQGKDDADYEVSHPFGTDFAAKPSTGLHGFATTVMNSVENSIFSVASKTD
mmetsp:Transcript_21127/g.31314  ORF Transcript_21127/g.31314 Transcript_21127/m.31314 type:complete len:515 (-) Transcript_21127:156-1700(-)|eukprot:CAMPEP_0194227516 /NCGR_PEP_ID=MMETSP0156-20130528/42896_1 /TAXON_ID=33649 /ORGANISM="Thalassionema nitzschioides, Strain L26-B" /LENGTH=514 /DNA_ID=CAMNT_0038959999 /DNA_START=897 /DNA_END=2441 /DNA_ORIENTATION=+